MSNRMTPQEGDKSRESRPAPDFSKFMVHDSFINSISFPSATGEEPHRLSRQQLEETAAALFTALSIKSPPLRYFYYYTKKNSPIQVRFPTKRTEKNCRKL